MKKSKFTETQIIKALKENEAGRSAEEISRELGVNKGTFYNLSADRQVGVRSTQEWKLIN